MEKAINSQQIIKESHLKLVFSLVSENEGISRADIKKITKLSATTVSTLADELIASGKIIETGAKNTGSSGRRAISLSVNPRGGYFAVVTVSGRHFRLRLFSLCFEEIFYEKVKYDASLPLSSSLTAFLKENVLADGYGQLLGIAVGVPAIVDENFNIVSSTVLDIKENDFVYKEIKSAFPTAEVVICNNSSLLAYAEKEFGDKSARCLVSVDISDGVGAAAVIEGVPFKGSGGMALEFGHLSIDIKGEKCRCGSRGCIETVANKFAILKKCQDILKKEILFEEIADFAKENGEIREHLNYVAYALSFAINNLINIMDPDAVIICGDIIALGEDFLNLIRDNLKEIALLGKIVPISYSSLGEKAEFKGGAKYVFDCLFR